MKYYDCLIVGAGHAGAQLALMLRQQKFSGTIGLLGEETDPPYERPPLSKEYLSGEKPFDRLLLLHDGRWAERGIDLLLGRHVESIDPVAHTVVCADSVTFGYGRLVWAAGGKPRRPNCPGHDLQGIHTIRNKADVDCLRAELSDSRKIAVIGGGYIGLEAAAVLASAGKSVVVLEAMERVLARVAGAPLSRFYEAEHRSRGVEIHLNVMVTRIVGVQGHVTGVELSDGTVIPADVVVAGIGIIPTVEPLRDAGAETANGVRVDQHCRASLTDVFAIGDCALHANDFAAGQLIRLESIQNANDQANAVAKTITGTPTPYHAVPWFWSKQYDLHLQTVGLSIGYDETVVRGDPETRSFSVIYLRQGRVLALDCVNATRDYVQGRALVLGSSMPSPRDLADITISLKSLVAA